jgi:hypothetical protein
MSWSLRPLEGAWEARAGGVRSRCGCHVGSPHCMRHARMDATRHKGASLHASVRMLVGARRMLCTGGAGNSQGADAFVLPALS